VCRFATTELPAHLSSVASARSWITEILTRWELEDVLDTAALLTSELVTNAIVHTRTGPSLSAAVAEGALEIGVRDRDPHPAPLRAPGGPADPAMDEATRPAEMGRGLLLVDRLAQEWGTTPQQPGKVVWLRLNTRRWPYGPDCRCQSEGLDRVPLASGHHTHPLPGIWDTPATPPAP
jgi:anti-sigma regulatory factor (Ser/Thr protein kinase)